MRPNTITISALVVAAAAAPLPLVSEANLGLSKPASSRLHTRQSDLNWIAEDFLPALQEDLKDPAGLVQDLTSYYVTPIVANLPKDLPSAITAATRLTAFIASVLEGAVDNILYLPKGFYYGNPLIPFSGELPKILAAVVALSAVVPPLREEILGALTKVPGAPDAAAAVAPLGSVLPNALAGLTVLSPQRGGDAIALPPGLPAIATSSDPLKGVLPSFLAGLTALSVPTSVPVLQAPKTPTLPLAPGRTNP